MTVEKQVPERLRAAARDAEVVVRAPGRANLIGEHTDYNDGFVLPVALDLAAYVAGRRRDGVCSLTSLEEQGEARVELCSGEGPSEGWGRYVTAVVRALLDEGVALRGLEGCLHSEVPVGSGLSSSAALEVAVATALIAEPLEPVRLAGICQRAENTYVGVESGIMDQLASAGCRAGHALMVDCRDNTVEQVPIPEDVTVLVVDSGIHRGLDESAYNERRKQCGAACEALGVKSLRDASLETLEGVEMDDVLHRRARHVITENDRVLATVEALRSGDLDTLRELFAASHRSLATDYEVSLPELDALVEIASALPGVYGSRLTGAGFGGCTVNLVASERAQSVAQAVVDAYGSATGNEARFWISRPAAGARVLRGD